SVNVPPISTPTRKVSHPHLPSSLAIDYAPAPASSPPPWPWRDGVGAGPSGPAPVSGGRALRPLPLRGQRGSAASSFTGARSPRRRRRRGHSLTCPLPCADTVAPKGSLDANPMWSALGAPVVGHVFSQPLVPSRFNLTYRLHLAVVSRTGFDKGDDSQIGTDD